MSRVVLTYGTFDLFHVGHLRLLRRLKGMGDKLIVGVSTDEFNALKGKKTVIPFAERAEIVSGIKYVDQVIAETCWEQKVEDIHIYGVGVFAMGDDWSGKFDYLKAFCDVAYLPRTEGISTTFLKSQIQNLV